MIKWYCFNKTSGSDDITSSKIKHYVPNRLKHLASNRDLSEDSGVFMDRSEVGVTVVTVLESGVTFSCYHVYGLTPQGWTTVFDNAREAFEAAEKVFASNYPELYLQVVMSECGRKRD